MLLILPWLFVAIVENSVLPRLRIVSKKGGGGEGGAYNQQFMQTTSCPPIFPQGQQSERNASARENYPTREKRGEVGGEKNKQTNTWGDFYAHSRFACSTIPEEKWGLLVVYSLQCIAYPFTGFNLIFTRFLSQPLSFTYGALCWCHTHARIDMHTRVQTLYRRCILFSSGVTLFSLARLFSFISLLQSAF